MPAAGTVALSLLWCKVTSKVTMLFCLWHTSLCNSSECLGQKQLHLFAWALCWLLIGVPICSLVEACEVGVCVDRSAINWHCRYRH
jgi:hypothetical protein